MLGRSSRVVSVAAVLAMAWLATGCSKSEDTKVAVSDSTVSATVAPPETAATDTTKKAPAGDPAKLGTLPVKPKTPPAHIQVEHVLIGFQGTIPGKNVTRTKDEAEKLAKDVLERARKGENFESLMQQYTDDTGPGVYGLANTGVTPDPANSEYARAGMVAGFSDVAFRLSVGNIDVAPYQPDKSKPGLSPYGWHIIKRLK